MDRYWKGAIEAVDPSERDSRNFERLHRHIQHVYETSPFYQRRLDEVGIRPEKVSDAASLQEVPVLTKPEIIADQAQDPPYGSILAVDPDSVVRQYIGLGPQTTYWTREDEQAAVEDGAWAFSTNGFRSSDVVDVTSMYNWVIAGTLMDDSCRAVGCAVIPGGIGMTTEHVKVWRWSRVTALFVFPTFLDELGDAVTEMGLDPARDFDLRVCAISGEQRSADAKQRLEGFWGGMKVREFYGGAEVPFIASQAEDGSPGMHVNPDLIIEVVDPETLEPVGEGEAGVIVATDLRRMAYPMIRYFTGDIIEGMTYKPGPSGRTTPRIGRILGRHGDIPRVKGLFLVPGQIQNALDRVGDLGRFQVVIDRPGNQDTVKVRVETEGASSEHELAPIVLALKNETRLTFEVEVLAEGTLEADAPTILDEREL